MRIPLSWLKDLVDISLPVEEVARRLTLAGLEVAGVERLGEEWENCWVALVTAVRPHPNADRLVLCDVSTGRESLTVVCGAPNVAQGQKAVLARPGARLFNPHTGALETLRPAKIRGVVSEGMLCSERELGLGEDHTGILVLPEDAPVGTPLRDYLGDTVLEVEVTANRPDALSLLGVAFEVAALSGGKAQVPPVDYPEEGPSIGEQVSIEVWDPDLCPRYTAALITGVRVGPSPWWLQERLRRAGQRPINNIVDVTNYVMLEMGQPLHAFDYHTLLGRKVIVRRARPGEVLVTLDGQERRLSPPMLVIADAERAVGLAGIMGGANSEVTEGTTAILLESASFHPFNTRRTAALLKLRTEASARFEKGLRPHLPPVALRRAVRLIQEMAGGRACRGIIDIFPAGEKGPPILTLTRSRLRRVLGMEPAPEEVEGALSSLGFGVRREGEGWRVEVPFWRSDISIEDDLAEEVARTLGYERVPSILLDRPLPPYQPDPLRETRERLRDLLVGAGLQEVITYSLVSREALERTGAPVGLRVANPLSPAHEYLRTSLRPSLLMALARNRPQEEGPLALFEMGRVYLPRLPDLPEEKEVAGLVMAGPLSPLSWLREEGELGFYEAKGVLEAVLERLGLEEVSFTPQNDPFFTPGRCARLEAGGKTIGTVGEVHPRVLEGFDLEGPVAYGEIDIPALLEVLPKRGWRYRPLPRYPGALRDLAVVVDRSIPARRVQEVMARHPLVARITLFDVYTGPPVPPGKRSLAFHLLFQAPDRTLTSDEVEQALREVMESLRREVGAVRRGEEGGGPDRPARTG